MRELRFEEAPDPGVRFRGSTRRNSVWGSRRENLPDEVQEGVVYRNAGARLRIASEIVDSDPGFQNGCLDKERVKTISKRSRKHVGAGRAGRGFVTVGLTESNLLLTGP
jgi:hypothetical protein